MAYYTELPEADKTTQEELSELLVDGESVIAIVRNQDFLTRLKGIDPADGGFLATLGDFGDSFWRLALTDQRLIQFSPAKTRNPDVYQLDAINNVDQGGFVGGTFEIAGSGFEEEFDDFHPDDVGPFIKSLREQIASS